MQKQEAIVMIEKIRKRDGRVEKFAPEKITSAIFKAAAACGGNDLALAQRLCDKVVELAEVRYQGKIPEVEQIQDLVEYVLIENGHAKTAKAYILYREKRKSARELNALIGATINMFGDYLGDKDWKVQENANDKRASTALIIT